MQDPITTSSDEQSHEAPSQAIVTLIADLEGTAPTELQPPLYSVVDPEALDSLFDSSATDESRTPSYTCFRYRGYEIRVEAGGDITITNLEAETGLAAQD